MEEPITPARLEQSFLKIENFDDYSVSDQCSILFDEVVHRKDLDEFVTAAIETKGDAEDVDDAITALQAWYETHVDKNAFAEYPGVYNGAQALLQAQIRADIEARTP